jgi:hypothetical protein
VGLNPTPSANLTAEFIPQKEEPNMSYHIRLFKGKIIILIHIGRMTITLEIPPFDSNPTS